MHPFTHKIHGRKISARGRQPFCTIRVRHITLEKGPAIFDMLQYIQYLSIGPKVIFFKYYYYWLKFI